MSKIATTLSVIFVILFFICMMLYVKNKYDNTIEEYNTMVTEKFNSELKNKFEDYDNVRIEEVPKPMDYYITYSGVIKMLYIGDEMAFIIYTDDISKELEKDKCVENTYYSEEFIILYQGNNEEVLSILGSKYNKL